MPSGYTAIIGEKPDVTFQEFALGCARAFGALIEMRDEPADAVIPAAFEPSPYHAERKREAEERLAQLETVTPEEAEREATAEREAEIQQRQQMIEKRKVLAVRYTAMIQKVESWTPPSPDHFGYKDFMLKQLRESLEFDCDLRYYSEPVPKKDVAAWLADQKVRCRNNIDYHDRSYKEEVERVRQRNLWISQLRESLNNNEEK